MAESRKYFFSNNGVTELFVGINASQTNIVVLTGAALPDPDYGGIATLVLRDDANGKYEIMNLVDRVGNMCIVERGAENTTPEEWPAGTIVRNALTAGFFEKLATLPNSHFRTSKLYPYVLIDSMNIGGGNIRRTPWLSPGYMGSAGGPGPEAVDLSGSIVSGMIASILLQYVMPHEDSLDIDGALLSGDITQFLFGFYSIQAESLDMNGAMLSGATDSLLVQYTMQGESIDNGGSLISGDMT